MRAHRTAVFLLLLVCLPGCCLCGAVEFSVSGLGWRTGKRIERLLVDIMDTADDPEARVDPAMVDDALLVLQSELSRKGFLSPKIEYVLLEGSEEKGRAVWDPLTELVDLPWEEGDSLHFLVHRGLRSYYESVAFTGLRAMERVEAEAFFFPPGGLLVTRGERAYAPSRLNRGLRSLRQRLGQLGYPEAVMGLEEPPVVASTGAVSLKITVDEGPLYTWGKTRVEGVIPEYSSKGLSAPGKGAIFNDESLQDWMAIVRKKHMEKGYPDVAISVEREDERMEGEDAVRVNVVLHVNPGPRVRLGSIQFDGLKRTNPRMLRKLSGLESGDWLNRLEVQSAQFHLGKLGIFRRIEPHFQNVPTEEGTAIRDLRFELEERQSKELSFLVGYGSYERVRVGLEARERNVFGRAHTGTIRLRQSMRSSAGLILYTIPRPTPWLSVGQIRLQGLLREEISFDREEALVAFGVERLFANGNIRTTAEYRYELLRSKNFKGSVLVGDENTKAGGLLLGFGWDTRDRLIAPRNGASLNAQLEVASLALGSETDFQRLMVRTSYHLSPGKGNYFWHFGLEGGVLSSLNSDALELPLNKRFFPGGENSIRGYLEGEASPRDAEGTAIGAEAYALAHVEMEVSLLDALSAVIFTDGLLETAELEHSDEATLVSVGIGLRYTTPLGPLRIEYGYNLNSRPKDPQGTLHFSIGFPF